MKLCIMQVSSAVCQEGNALQAATPCYSKALWQDKSKFLFFKIAFAYSATVLSHVTSCSHHTKSLLNQRKMLDGCNVSLLLDEE